MADIQLINEHTIRISVDLTDAIHMIDEASRNVKAYAHDIVTIFEKMPAFDYTSFCFYAYDSAELFEFILGVDPRKYRSFSLDAPDSFFFTLYGGMAALYDMAKKYLPEDQSA
ncbi:hypothetical protein Alches_28270 [Alicyclobacillus hesperidum subsp. aegles]|uniref:hypothetical protein n=1 Tax=Alicyclobacillus hesperidum TaxID=89784 RepID=UPI00222C98F3|nr:hypothetical protein [Alicyclobacillus hesperidum]GLG02786.1 hypothetical protein Alches_28270 [Alicyclobacillus hesperidum subsp. aegles]